MPPRAALQYVASERHRRIYTSFLNPPRGNFPLIIGIINLQVFPRRNNRRGTHIRYDSSAFGQTFRATLRILRRTLVAHLSSCAEIRLRFSIKPRRMQISRMHRPRYRAELRPGRRVFSVTNIATIPETCQSKLLVPELKYLDSNRDGGSSSSRAVTRYGDFPVRFWILTRGFCARKFVRRGECHD